MQVVLSATLSHLYYVLRDFHVPTDTRGVGAELFTGLISTLVPLALNLPMTLHLQSG